MDNSSIPLPFSPSATTSTFITDGFYTDTPANDTITYFSPDQKNLIIGCVLGTFTFMFLVIGSIFATKLYFRKRQKEAHKEKYIEKIYQQDQASDLMDFDDDEETLGRRSTCSIQRHQISLPPQPPSNNTSMSGSSKKFQLSSILDPSSQFSLAVQRASEIPNSPESPTP